jgi:hypothetical protein
MRLTTPLPVGGGDVLMILLLCKKMIAMGWLDMLFC